MHLGHDIELHGINRREPSVNLAFFFLFFLDENTAESEKNYVRNGPNKSESSLTLKNLAPDLESLLVVWGIAAASDWLRS